MKHELENGIHEIPNEIYHASNGISRSALMEFKKSPYHYWHKYLNPERATERPTPAMKLGEYVHALVLEPNYFLERYALQPELQELPKVGLLKDIGREEYNRQKAARDSASCANEFALELFEKQSEGKEIIKPDIYNEARTLADAVLSNDIAQALFRDVKVEQSIYFTHKPTGLQCKVRPDAWCGSVVTDLKTCADASFDWFQSAAYRGGYFLQAAMIKQALESIGESLEQFVFFCVEKSAPYACVWYPVDEESMNKGEIEFDRLMCNLADCMNSNQWQSYESQPLTYPRYARFHEEY